MKAPSSAQKVQAGPVAGISQQAKKPSAGESAPGRLTPPEVNFFDKYVLAILEEEWRADRAATPTTARAKPD